MTRKPPFTVSPPPRRRAVPETYQPRSLMDAEATLNLVRQERDAARDREVRAVRRAERLLAALGRYGVHQWACKAREVADADSPGKSGRRGPCSCGLDQALERDDG